MIRVSKHTLKFANKHKLDVLERIYEDFKSCVILYIDLILKGDLPLKTNVSCKLLPNNVICHADWKGIAYRTASGIVRSNLKHTKNKTFKRYQKLYAKCKEQNIHKPFLNKKYSELSINYLKRIKIDIKTVSINLSSHLFNIKESNLFDSFIRIYTPYKIEGFERKYLNINVPIKQHKHSLKFKDWTRKNTIQLNKINGNFYITLIYEKEKCQVKQQGKSIGLDCGYNKLISDSNGVHYGEELKQVYIKLANKRRGSKSHKRLLQYKKNLTNQIVNSINLDPYSLVVVEDLKNVKHKSKFSTKFNNKLQYWSYKQVLAKLALRSEEEGFFLLSVDPAYTSQTCSGCGIIDKSNRRGETYQCTSCGLLIDADTNGAINIHNRGIYSSFNEQSESYQ